MPAPNVTGNTIVVVAAGTAPWTPQPLRIECITLWCATTLADFIVTDVNTGGIEVFRLSPDRSQIAPFSQVFPIRGQFGNLTFNTVTACTAYIQLG